MRNNKIDFNKNFKKVLIIYAAIFLAGIVFMFIPGFGVKLDINFSGGTKLPTPTRGTLRTRILSQPLKRLLKNRLQYQKKHLAHGDIKNL